MTATDTVKTTSTAAARGANKAANTIIDTVVEASDHIFPQVVETAEVAMAMDLPTKVVVNQKLIVGVVAVTAVAAGVAGTLGWQKLKERRTIAKAKKDAEELYADATTKPAETA